VLLPILLPPSSRWRNQPTFLSKEEIENIFILLQNHFHQTLNPVELIRILIKENEETKNQLQTVQKENEETKNQLQTVKKENEEIKLENNQLKNQNQELKAQNENLAQTVQQKTEEIKNLSAVQVNLSGCNGIISTLKQNDPNPVLLASSSNFNSVPENVLNPDDKCWRSQNVPNSWIIFNFKNKQISPSRYLIRNGNHYSDYSPQGWKLEGSNDQTNWATIHEVRDCKTFNQQNQEASFSCQADKFFSFLRFIQIQENISHSSFLSSSHNFNLNFVEFSGKIISRN
jgi:hypothetical protein